MSAVTIQISNVETIVTRSGIEVALTTNHILETIVGIPGPQGNSGVQGPQGTPGVGVPAGGNVGQVLAKTSVVDAQWSTSLKIDEPAGHVGIGTTTPLAPLHVSGNDQAIVIENALQPGNIFAIAPGRAGVYQDNLIFSRGADITDPANYLMRFTAFGAVTFEKGVSIKDGTSLGSHSSGALAYYKPFDGVKADLSFRGAAFSNLAEWRIGGYYHDTGGVWHAANVAKFEVSSAGGVRLGIGTQTPTTTLDVNGPARVGSYMVAALPSASGNGAGAIIYVSDESGGPVMAFSDGTNWRRMTDRVVVS